MASAKAPAITADLFRQHGQGCRVYNYESAYEKVNSAALAKGITIKEELKNQGFKDFASFYCSCPRFNLLCWPSEFSDLGSGAVLYFHFLVFCAGMLFIAFLVQMPALVEYAGAGKLSSWNSDAGGFDTGDIGKCRCIGSNNGFTGPDSAFVQQDYGTTCGAWDLGWCRLGGAGPYASSRGLWCCRSWCYADPDCPNTMDEDSPSLSNRLLESKNLVRSYYACQQPDTSACGPSSTMSSDVAYPHDAFKESTAVPGGFMRLTGPGNLGPDNGESQLVLASYALTLVLFCAAVVVAHQYQLRSIARVDQGTTQPADFAVLVEGLPGTATDEEQILDFFSKHAVRDKNDTEIVKVVIGWESKEYREGMRELKRLQGKLLFSYMTSSFKCLARLLSLEPVESLMQKMAEVQKQIRSTAPDVTKKLTCSGVAVVVFRYKTDHIKCLERWSSFSAKWLQREADGCFGMQPGSLLPRFFFRSLKVRQAPNPSNIRWEDLGVQRAERLRRLAKTNLFMLILIGLCFGIVYGCQRLKDGSSGNFAWSILPVVGISIANICLMIGSKRFGDQEYHNTVAEKTASQSLKMAVAMVVNTAGVIFFTNAQPKEWYKTLVDDVFLLMAVTGIIQPLMFFWDFKYSLVGAMRRRNLTEKQLGEWNKVVQDPTKPKTKDEAIMMQKQKMQVAKQIEKMKEAFQPSELDTTKRYAYAVRTFICCLLYSPLMPLVLPIGMIGLGVQYWVDKYMLLRWFKRPSEPYSEEQALLSLSFIRFAGALLLPVAAFVFVHPSWKRFSDCVWYFGCSMGFAVVFCMVPLFVSRTFLCLRCIPGLRKVGMKVVDAYDEYRDYYKAQHLWTKEMKYHKSQFLYKMVPESKNPEMLTLGSDRAMKADDLKGSYGAAADSLAAGSGAPSCPALHVRGHGRVDMRSSSAAPGMASSTPEPLDPPTSGTGRPESGGRSGTPLAVAEADDGAGDGTVAATGAGGPSAVGVAAPGPPATAAPPPLPPPHVVWSFETGRGFHAFDDDAQAFVECKYQQKLRGGDKRVQVMTNGITVSLDFDMMTQKAGHGRVRKIQREGPS